MPTLLADSEISVVDVHRRIARHRVAVSTITDKYRNQQFNGVTDLHGTFDFLMVRSEQPFKLTFTQVPLAPVAPELEPELTLEALPNQALHVTLKADSTLPAISVVLVNIASDETEDLILHPTTLGVYQGSILPHDEGASFDGYIRTKYADAITAVCTLNGKQFERTLVVDNYPATKLVVPTAVGFGQIMLSGENLTGAVPTITNTRTGVSVNTWNPLITQDPSEYVHALHCQYSDVLSVTLEGYTDTGLLTTLSASINVTQSIASIDAPASAKWGTHTFYVYDSSYPAEPTLFVGGLPVIGTHDIGHRYAFQVTLGYPNVVGSQVPLVYGAVTKNITIIGEDVPEDLQPPVIQGAPTEITCNGLFMADTSFNGYLRIDGASYEVITG